MTKAELIDALRDYNDDDLIVIEVHDTMLSEDLYDFTFDAVWLGRDSNGENHELRLTAINHHETIDW